MWNSGRIDRNSTYFEEQALNKKKRSGLTKKDLNVPEPEKSHKANKHSAITQNEDGKRTMICFKY